MNRRKLLIVNIITGIVAISFFAACTSADKSQIKKTLERQNRVYTALDIPFERIGTIKPKSSHETTSKYWTIGCETVDRDYTIYNEYKDYLTALGIRKARFQAGWAKTEKEKGVYDFTWIDEVVEDMDSRNMELWMELSYGNPIYKGGGGYDLGAGLPVSEEALAAWDKWVEAMVTRYKDKIHEWEIWNEPDLSMVKGEIMDNPDLKAKVEANSPEGLAKFNIRTARIIKRIDPSAKIAGLAIVRLSKLDYIKDFLQVFKEENALDLLEWISFHGYPYNPDDMYSEHGEVKESLQKARELIASFSPKIKLRQGESGCPSEYQVGHHALRNYNWTELTQAKWFLRRMMDDRANDIDEASVFCIMDMTYRYKVGTPEEYKFFNRFGLLRCDSTKRVEKVKLSYYAVQNAISTFDQSLERVEDVKCNIEAFGKMKYALYSNTDNGQKMLVVWDGTKIPADTYKTQDAVITIEDCDFDKPVWVDLLSGRVYEIPSSAYEKSDNRYTFKVPVYDSPIVITNAGTLPTEEY